MWTTCKHTHRRHDVQTMEPNHWKLQVHLHTHIFSLTKSQELIVYVAKKQNPLYIIDISITFIA